MNGNSAPLARSGSLIEEEREQGLHLGAQLYVSMGGVVQADLTFGEAREGIPMRRDTLVPWLSSCKPLTAVAIGQLYDRGRLSLDDPVVKFLAEFGRCEKELVTIRQLLTHTGGFRTADKCDFGKDWDEIIECICASPLEPNWVPGARAAYHVSASWYILGELVRRLDGRPLERYVQEELFQPCHMRDCWLALPAEQFRAYGDRLAFLYHTDKTPPLPHRRWNNEADAAVCRPGRNGRGPIRELGRFYEVLLALRSGAGKDGPGPLKPATVQEFTRRQRIGMFDDTFQHRMDWGLGFMINSNRYGRETIPYGYGRFCSDETFGHSGSQSSCAFADPAHGLVVAWAFNGMPGERRHQQRARNLNSAIYQDLGLG